MDDSTVQQLGRKIRELRIGRGWRQIDLAAHAGLSENYISDLENGRKEICLNALISLSTSFKISASELIRGL